MTEKEFEQLKVGDKVWIITDWFNKSNEGMKAVELEVKGKEEDEQIIQFLGVCFKADYCSLTKSEAWENEIKRCEEALKSQEREVEKDRKLLDRYKAELAKAKEEERRKEWWYVSYKEQAVAKLPLVMDSDAEAEIFETEQEAYSALAEYYKGKYEEALSQAGKGCWIVYGEKPDLGIVFAENWKEDEEWKGGIYFSCSACQTARSHWVHIHTQIFRSRQEAEAELERRKNNA